MIKDLIAVFKKPTAKAVAADMLHDAQVQVLKHQACADYHAKMAEYHQQTITRLGTTCLQPSNASSVSATEQAFKNQPPPLLKYPRLAKPSDTDQYYLKPAYTRYPTKANKHHKGKNHG